MKSAPLTMPELTEVEGKLTAKRAELAAIFSEAKTSEGIDLMAVKSLDGTTNAERVEVVRTKNEEIDALAVQAEGLRKVLDAAAAADERDELGAVDPSPTRKSFADRVFDSELYRGESIVKGHTVEFSDVDVKATMSTSAGWAADVERRDTVVPLVVAPLAVVDLLNVTSTGSVGSVTYWKESTRTNGAAEVAEDGTMPEAALELTETSSAIRKVAVLLPVTDEQLEDRPRARGYITETLPAMIRERVCGQAIVGNGTAPNLRGILNTSGIQTQAKGSDPTPDAVYKAIVKVMTTGGALPDAYVTNPLDWADVRLLRTSDGVYIWGSPSDAGPDRIWGLRTVLESRVTENTGIVGAWKRHSELAVRKGVEVDVGLVNDDFADGRQHFRARFRAALIFDRPAAFCTVTGI